MLHLLWQRQLDWTDIANIFTPQFLSILKFQSFSRAFNLDLLQFEALNVPQIPWITRAETPVQAAFKSGSESSAAWYNVLTILSTYII